MILCLYFVDLSLCRAVGGGACGCSDIFTPWGWMKEQCMCRLAVADGTLVDKQDKIVCGKVYHGWSLAGSDVMNMSGTKVRKFIGFIRHFE